MSAGVGGEGVRGHLSSVFIPSVKGAVSINSSQIRVKMKVRSDSVLEIKKTANTAMAARPPPHTHTSPLALMQHFTLTLHDAEKKWLKWLVSGGEGMEKSFFF